METVLHLRFPSFSVIFRRFRYFPVFSVIFRCFQVFSGVFMYFPAFSIIFMRFQLFSGVFRYFPVCVSLTTHECGFAAGRNPIVLTIMSKTDSGTQHITTQIKNCWMPDAETTCSNVIMVSCTCLQTHLANIRCVAGEGATRGGGESPSQNDQSANETANGSSQNAIFNRCY